jgi:hypothetical protein
VAPEVIAGKVKVALLPAESAMTPPLRTRAAADCWFKSALLSPGWTV